MPIDLLPFLSLLSHNSPLSYKSMSLSSDRIGKMSSQESFGIAVAVHLVHEQGLA